MTSRLPRDVTARPILIDALGMTVAIDPTGASDDLAAEVRRAWADALVADGVEREPVAVIPVVADHPASDEQALAELSQRVTLAAIEARRGELWMLHAAGLALPDGRVLVLIGPSGRGKTTAARALAAHLGYVSDETVGIDLETGRVLPYRKPLSIIEQPGHKAQRAPSDLGLAPLPPRALTVAGIVLLDRREDAPPEPVVEDVDLDEIIDELVGQTSHLAALPLPLQRIAALLAGIGGVRRVTYREATTLIDVVEQLAAVGAPMRWRPAGVGTDGAPGYSRSGAVDAIVLDDRDRVAVLQIDATGVGTVRVLGGIAPAIWLAADGATLEELVAAAVAEHGSPDGVDVTSTVAAAIAELEAIDLLRDRPSAGSARG